MATGHIIAIEFDRSVFDNTVKCLNFLRRDPKYFQLLATKGFSLKQFSRSFLMSDENRAVFGFYKEFWRASKTRTERPERTVVVIYNDGGELFTENEIPPFSQRYQKKQRLAQAKLAEQDRKSILRAEKKKEKRKRAKAMTMMLPKKLTFLDEPIKLKEEKSRPSKKKKISVEKPKKASVPMPIEAAMNILDEDVGEFPVYSDADLLLTAEKS